MRPVALLPFALLSAVPLLTLLPPQAAFDAAAGAGEPQRATVRTATDETTDADSVSDLNQKVLAFCEAHKGEQVGNGGCGSLPMAALRAAGAQTHFHRSAEGAVWGEQIARLTLTAAGPKLDGDLKQIQAGDILQFENTKFVNRAGVAWIMAEHTAVVSKAAGDRRTLVTLQQNFGGKRTVQQVTMRLSDMRTGVMTVYRPQPW